MPSCVAIGCKNRMSDAKKRGISFHRFPAKIIQREAWIRAVGRKDWLPSECSRLCSDHFAEEMIDRSLSKPQLKPYALPIIFETDLSDSEKDNKVSLQFDDHSEVHHTNNETCSSLFPAECIFCHENKTFFNKINGSRCIEPLTKCTTTVAEEKIKSQADKKNDFDIIRLISGQDLVAREARYHRSCYVSYMYEKRHGTPGRRRLYQLSWNYFKENVERKLGEEQQCIPLKELLDEFIKTVDEVEGLDASSYSIASLKLYLQQSFPTMNFHQIDGPTNMGELVSMPKNTSSLYMFRSDASSESAASFAEREDSQTLNSAKLQKRIEDIKLSSDGKFLVNFDPEKSGRETRKMNRKATSQNRGGPHVYDEKGVHIETGVDLCDCLEMKCPGCFFPCPKCGSNKCGVECRVNRKYTISHYDIEGTTITIKNPLL